jgi:dynein heavy chain, axonemal
VASEVAPKQERLEKMNEELSNANIELSEKQRQLSEVMEEVANLQKKCDDTLNEKNRLTIEVQRCSARLIRAEKLKHSLKDEKINWTETVAKLRVDVKYLAGDIFLGAAVISYLGPFSGEFRDELKEMWRQRVLDREIPSTGESWDFVKTMGDPALIREWRIGGLPSDDFSAESGLIATKGERWPLMIDPQGQAGNWIKHYEGRKLQVTSVKSLRLMSVVEKAVGAGVPLLVEDFGETVEPVLDNLLYKRYYKSGGKKVIMIGDREIEYGAAERGGGGLGVVANTVRAQVRGRVQDVHDHQPEQPQVQPRRVHQNHGS